MSFPSFTLFLSLTKIKYQIKVCAGILMKIKKKKISLPQVNQVKKDTWVLSKIKEIYLTCTNQCIFKKIKFLSLFNLELNEIFQNYLVHCSLILWKSGGSVSLKNICVGAIFIGRQWVFGVRFFTRDQIILRIDLKARDYVLCENASFTCLRNYDKMGSYFSTYLSLV